MSNSYLGALLLSLFMLLSPALTACASEDPGAPAAATAAPAGEPPAPMPTPAPPTPAPPTPTPAPDLTGVRGIVDPANFGWPRQVEGLNGIVTVPAKPERIITASVGHDETVLALAPGARLVAVGAPTKIDTYSRATRRRSSPSHRTSS